MGVTKNFKEYSKTLPLARDIYHQLYGEPKTHTEWAERFNLVGEINNVIIKHEK